MKTNHVNFSYGVSQIGSSRLFMGLLNISYEICELSRLRTGSEQKFSRWDGVGWGDDWGDRCSLEKHSQNTYCFCNANSIKSDSIK